MTQDLPAMDATHREFAAFPAEVSDAPDDDLVSVFDGLISHTDGHFGHSQEYRRRDGATVVHEKQLR
jgi:hypothetical protein